MKDFIKFWIECCYNNDLVAYFSFIAILVGCGSMVGIAALICNAVAK